MLKRFVAMVLILFCLSLTTAPTALAAKGLKNYVDSLDGYEFLYPNGWVEVKVSNGPDIVFHDLIEVSENVSVVINPVPEGKSLEDLGSPSEVAYRLSKFAIAPPESGRKAELISAEKHEVSGQPYYIMEYAVRLPDGRQRHNLASAVVRRGQLFTFNASTSERRWAKVKSVLANAVSSFRVY